MTRGSILENLMSFTFPHVRGDDSREHSRKPDEIIPIIEACSAGPRIELFARGDREGWDMWGNQAVSSYEPTWNTYKNHTVSKTG